MTSRAAPSPARRPHRAYRAEDAVRGLVQRLLLRRGWTPHVLPYPGYGTPERVRVLGRVLLVPPGSRPRELEGARGWRRFLSAAMSGAEVEVTVGGRRTTVVSERGGYLDVVLDAALPPGRQVATFVTGTATSEAPLFVVDPRPGLGLVSDIDDTVVVTALPRPLLAFWNTFVRHESARRPVPGMAGLYREVLRRHPGAFVVYVSTGAWNVAPALTAFLARHGFPPGPLLLTDWGPTPQGWFRSGSEHKRGELRRLLAELPQLRWLLVGDDGQRDPVVYGEVADALPDRVLAVAIRRLTPSQQVLAHGTTAPLPGAAPEDREPAAGVPRVEAPDGAGLLAALERAGVLPLTPAAPPDARPR